MVDEKPERTDRIELRNGSHITTKEFNLARSGWLYTREKQEPESKNDITNGY